MSGAPIHDDAVRVMAHVGDRTPSPEHSVFWKTWFQSLIETTPELCARTDPDPSDPSATHEFVSRGDVRIGCTLVVPESAPIRAALVCVHGAGTPDALEHEARRWRGVAEKGVAVLCVRVRGFPGSRTDIEGRGIGFTSDERGWFTRGLSEDEPNRWVVPHMVSDVCNAARVMRNALLGRDESGRCLTLGAELDAAPVYLHGVSLGGGLGVIAAAQLSGRVVGEPVIERIALRWPSMGAMGWRLAHTRSGLAEVIHEALEAHPDRREALLDRLRLCDPVVHGRRVRVPTLALLAAHDDVVPGEAAAAVYNAIEADPGRKWRMCIERGHMEGDVALTKRIATFNRALEDFFDPARRPLDSMHAWDSELGVRAMVRNER
jgi:cephalosporin-C deacetylase-like acetyl esterase